MGNYVTEQLALFLRSIALGAVLGLVYDLLGVLRGLGGRLWGGVLDVLFCLTAASSLFLFVMAGDGEMRIFVVLGTAGGMLLFLWLAGPLLRPVWRFWLSVFQFPVRLARDFLKKCGQTAKKLFSFGRSRVIMGVSYLRRGRTEGGDQDETDGQP